MRIRAIYILLVFSLALAARGSPGISRPSSQDRFYSIKFNDQLRMARDLTLIGSADSTSVSFTCESRWRVMNGTSLHLFVQHSKELNGNRSVLSISLNSGVLKSLVLDEEIEEPTEFIIQVPPGLIKQQNRLVFSVEQASTGKTPPGQPRTLVSNQSFLLVHYEQQPPELDLGLLPLPLLDPKSYRAQRLSVLVPKNPASATLEATALLVQRLFMQAIAEPLTLEVVDSIQPVRDPLLIVGTPQEQPGVRMFQQSGGFLIQGQNREETLSLSGGRTLTESEGLVALTSKSVEEISPVLVVTGNSPNGVLNAARGLWDPASKISGRLAVFSQETERPLLKLRQWPGFIPPQDRFTLADLGFEMLELSAQRNRTLIIPLNALPDTRFFTYGHKINLEFKLNPKLLRADSAVEIRLNNALLGQYEVLRLAKGLSLSIKMQVPSGILGQHNLLEVVWHDTSAENPDEPFCWLLSSSAFFLPRDYRAELPDLSLLQFSLYPFSLRADLSDTIILVPKEIDKEMFGTLLEISCALGRILPGERPDFRFKRMAELTETDKANFHFINFDVGNNAERLQQLTVHPKAILLRESLRNSSILQETTSPWNSRKFMLTVAARSDAALQQGVRDCFSAKRLRQYSGDTVLLMPNRAIGFRLGSRQIIKEYSYLTHFKVWLRANWMTLPVILAVAGGFLFSGLRWGLKRYKSRKSLEYLASSKGPGPLG